MPAIDPRPFLVSLFETAVRAADTLEAIKAHLPDRPKGRTIVIGAGKAASQMAASFEKLWEGPYEGVVVARHGPVEKTGTIRVLQSAHPVPDEAGLVGSQALLDAVAGLTEDDLVIALISGGGSALLPAPPEGLTLADEIAVNKALLGLRRADFGDEHGAQACLAYQGRAAWPQAAYPARVVSLVVSDVPGDNPALSPPGRPCPTAGTAEDALPIVADCRMALPDSVHGSPTSVRGGARRA